MQIFYNPSINIHSTDCTFDLEESRHIIKVLRTKEGETVWITNGKGYLFEAKIIPSKGKQCQAAIVSSLKKSRKNPWLHLAVAPTKMNDRYEWFLEKATEIGIDEITPIICHRSERRVIKMERFEKVLQTAMKQSLRTFLPKLNPAISMTDFLAQQHEGQLFIAHCGEEKKTELKNQAKPDLPTTLLIGPEGDFSPKEIKKALDKRYLPVSLGDHRLRTETAAIVGCTVINLVNSV